MKRARTARLPDSGVRHSIEAGSLVPISPLDWVQDHRGVQHAELESVQGPFGAVKVSVEYVHLDTMHRVRPTRAVSALRACARGS